MILFVQTVVAIRIGRDESGMDDKDVAVEVDSGIATRKGQIQLQLNVARLHIVGLHEIRVIVVRVSEIDAGEEAIRSKIGNRRSEALPVLPCTRAIVLIAMRVEASQFGIVQAVHGLHIGLYRSIAATGVQRLRRIEVVVHFQLNTSASLSREVRGEVIGDGWHVIRDWSEIADDFANSLYFDGYRVLENRCTRLNGWMEVLVAGVHVVHGRDASNSSHELPALLGVVHVLPAKLWVGNRVAISSTSSCVDSSIDAVLGLVHVHLNRNALVAIHVPELCCHRGDVNWDNVHPVGVASPYLPLNDASDAHERAGGGIKSVRSRKGIVHRFKLSLVGLVHEHDASDEHTNAWIYIPDALLKVDRRTVRSRTRSTELDIGDRIVHQILTSRRECEECLRGLKAGAIIGLHFSPETRAGGPHGNAGRGRGHVVRGASLELVVELVRHPQHGVVGGTRWHQIARRSGHG